MMRHHGMSTDIIQVIDFSPRNPGIHAGEAEGFAR